MFWKLISVLERLGVTVNIQKSAVSLRWSGTHHKKARKQFVKRKLDHQVLCIPSEQGLFHEIPTKKKHKYLGYHNFQRDAMKVTNFDLSKCTAGSQRMHCIRLRRWLYGSHVFDLLVSMDWMPQEQTTLQFHSSPRL